MAFLTAGCQDWSGYLFGPGHSSDNTTATAITAANASSLSNVWSFLPPGDQGGVFYSSPTVYNNQVYVGSGNGTFYDLDENTGAVVWSQFTAQQQSTTCAGPALGFVSTATVAPDPTSGAETVYVAAPDGYLYAWNAADGTLLWRSVVAIPSSTQNDYFNWSSPTVANGKVYVGVASNCDNPLVPGGGERVYDQSTGTLLASFDTIPTGDTGGSVWSSAMVAADGSVYVTTGNSNYTGGALGYSDAIVRLDPQTLQPQDSFTTPELQHGFDTDFGGSVTTWTANLDGVPTPMVGACNKNGVYYALRASDLAAGPVWQDRVGSIASDGTDCLAAAVWDQNAGRLFLAGNDTTINGKPYTGSLEEVDPATGSPLWQTGLPGAVMGTPTLDGTGVLAVGTTDYTGAPDSAYLIDSVSGRILSTISSADAQVFAQPVFADKHLLVATAGKGLWAYEASALSTSVTSPGNAASLSGIRQLVASASANATHVQFMVTGSELPSALVIRATNSSGSWTASWDTTVVPDGSYVIQSVASDGTGDVSNSSPIGVFVDSTAPKTTMILPADGATVSGTSTLDASASDAVGVTKVEFHLDGGALNDALIGTATYPSFGWATTWDTTSVPNGTYSLTSVAYDEAGNTGTSTEVTVTVNNAPPNTAVVIPANGASISGNHFVLDASAAASVSQVQYQLSGGALNDAIIATATPTIYGWVAVWDSSSIPNGTYSLQSVASYAGGVTGTSAPITVSVTN